MSDEKVERVHPELVNEDFKLTAFSLVSHCPYCGAKFDEEGTTNDGKPCSHPTKMQNAEYFMAAKGDRR